jgi:hypothetical protein
MLRKFLLLLFKINCLCFREYADEAIKQGKVFKEVAKEKLEEVAAETLKSKFSRQKMKYKNKRM